MFGVRMRGEGERRTSNAERRLSNPLRARLGIPDASCSAIEDYIGDNDESDAECDEAPERDNRAS